MAFDVETSVTSTPLVDGRIGSSATTNEHHSTSPAPTATAQPSTSSSSRFSRLREVIWDGPRPASEHRLIQKLDLHLMTWATYGYFVRLLDSTNITNAYVSGMREDLAFKGNQYNLLTTFFTCGYIVTMIPSQLLLTRLRPSWYLPTVELLWTCATFCFAAVKDVRQVFALRWVVGMLEAPFAVGVITVMGGYYTPRELAKRIAIFYSASYAASMFSGYLQAGIYRGMDGHLGLAGWRWLFIFCGVISLPGAIFGYYAVPDNPYVVRARWMKPEEKAAHIARMEAIKKSPPVRLTWAKIGKILRSWRVYVLTLTLICHCIVTQPLNYFAVWLKSLNRFSVYQVNLFPTAAQALGLVTTLAYSWISDGLGGKRWQLMIVPSIFNFIGMVIVAVYPNYGAVFFGYMINAASWGYWPLVFAWTNEFCADDAEQRAIIIGVAQALGQAFVAWVPPLILNVGKYAPRFHLGFSIMCGVSVLQFANVFILRYLVNLDKEKEKEKEKREWEVEREGQPAVVQGDGIGPRWHQQERGKAGYTDVPSPSSSSSPSSSYPSSSSTISKQVIEVKGENIHHS